MKRKKVLIVDDDKEFLDELKSMLLNDYVVDVIDEVSGVVKIADEKQPDIIFLDMKMPGKTGFQVADDLQNFLSTAGIPIIAMTGYFTERQHVNFMKSIGIVDCIIKPFETQDFIAKINQYAGAPDGHDNG